MLTLRSLLLTLLLGSTLLLTPTACRHSDNSDSAAPTPARVLVNSTLIGKYTKSDLQANYSGIGTVFRYLINYGISVYKIEYNTTNTDGKAIRASGALVVPDNAGAMPLLSFQHGTTPGDDGAPSNFRGGSEANQFGSVFASQGYIISIPDYIGLGVSKDLPQTYEQRSGLATSCLDMLRASREFLLDNRVNWNGRLFLAGYSEGGYATMALQKKIEEETGSEFNLVASSMGAGAYDKTDFMNYIINQKSSGVADFNKNYIWVLLTYDRIYGLNRPMSYYFKEPYATQIARDGRNAEISVSLNETFTDQFRQGIQNGTDTAFIKAVADNDIYDWKPRVPTRLYHGDADNLVPFFNSQNAYNAMQKRGATNVQLFPQKGLDHFTGVVPFITGTYTFFTSIQ